MSYRIAEHGKVCGLTLTVTPEGEVPGEILAASRLGWAMILSGLKSLLETGEPLPITVADAMKAIARESGE